MYKVDFFTVELTVKFPESFMPHESVPRHARKVDRRIPPPLLVGDVGREFGCDASHSSFFETSTDNAFFR